MLYIIKEKWLINLNQMHKIIVFKKKNIIYKLQNIEYFKFIIIINIIFIFLLYKIQNSKI